MVIVMFDFNSAGELPSYRLLPFFTDANPTFALCSIYATSVR